MTSATAFADDVRIFTDEAHPVAIVPGATVVELDAPARLVSELSAGLPVDPQRAEAMLRQRLASPGFADRQKKIGLAYQAVADAYSLGVAKLPAVVVDGRYVVYGDADTRRALGCIAAYRRAGQ
ncbi:integrating conjugative element protein (TIGR03757 family) [Xanthomonas sacchari]|nr:MULTISPECIES: TIGR03757 family integrating conjugative element protein [unclassified Xanthomonas]MBB6366717.1 integrating conjugative element protein (TIGR03757 family) [Xanthomonas sp. F10]